MTGLRQELQPALEGMLSAHLGRPCAITELRRESYIYSTSHALEHVEAELADGGTLRLIVKELGLTGLLQDARASKPQFLYEPRREVLTYQLLLDRAELGTATCYGVIADEPSTPDALVLEKVEGLELYQVGDVDVWVHVARWLAGMHGHAELAVDSVRQRNPHLISYDGAYYRRWLDRARRFRRDEAPDPAWSIVEQGLERAWEHLDGAPHSFVHGEFYASNVLVAAGQAGGRVCPVDWEMAGVGPALLDLAALCTGWDDAQVEVIAQGYHLACDRSAGWPLDEKELLLLLNCCQLCLAVQWLGWAPGWTAPPENARDWLGEATRLSERIGS